MVKLSPLQLGDEPMNTTRRDFLAAAGAVCAMPYVGLAASPEKKVVAVQLYSIDPYIRKNGLEKSLAEVAKIGYKAVEFVNYFGKSAAELKKLRMELRER